MAKQKNSANRQTDKMEQNFIDSMTPKYWQDKGFMRVEEDVCMETIDDACKIFKATPKHYGFLQSAGAEIDESLYVWCPSKESTTWKNELIRDAKDAKNVKIYEGKIKNQSSGDLKLKDGEPKTRIVFFREKDKLGYNYYRFAGVFAWGGLSEGKRVWKRIATRISTKAPYTYE